MPTDPSPVMRPDGAGGPPSVVEAQLRARRDQEIVALGQLEAELAVLQEDPSVLQEDRDATRLLPERAREALAATEQAMARVVEGTYGRCQVCGAAIPPERLEAVPDATTCVACVATS